MSLMDCKIGNYAHLQDAQIRNYFRSHEQQVRIGLHVCCVHLPFWRARGVVLGTRGDNAVLRRPGMSGVCGRDNARRERRLLSRATRPRWSAKTCWERHEGRRQNALLA